MSPNQIVLYHVTYIVLADGYPEMIRDARCYTQEGYSTTEDFPMMISLILGCKPEQVKVLASMTDDEMTKLIGRLNQKL
jgi:hypothetical protein